MNSKKIFLTMAMMLSCHVSQPTSNFFSKYATRKAMASTLSVGSVLIASLICFKNKPVIDIAPVKTAEVTDDVSVVGLCKKRDEYPAEGIGRMRRIQAAANKDVDVANFRLANPEACQPIKKPIL